MKRYAWVTLLSSENYLKGVQVLAYSLQSVRSKYKLLVAVTENILNESLIKKISYLSNVEYVSIPYLKYGQETESQYKNKPVLNTASKLALLRLDYWDKLIYLDADILVIENMDNLFDQYSDTSMVKYPEDDYGFSALFVIEPWYHSEKEYQYLKTIILHHVSFDGDVFGTLWSAPKHDYHYQIPKEYLWNYDTKYNIPSNIKAIHYQNEDKPWFSPYNNSPFQSILLYQQVLKKVEEITNVQSV